MNFKSWTLVVIAASVGVLLLANYDLEGRSQLIETPSEANQIHAARPQGPIGQDVGAPGAERTKVGNNTLQPLVFGKESREEKIVLQVVDARTGVGILASVVVAGRSLVTQIDGRLEIELPVNQAFLGQPSKECVGLKVSSPGYEELVVQWPVVDGGSQKAQRVALQIAPRMLVNVLDVHLKAAEGATVYVATFSHGDNLWRKGTLGVTDADGKCMGRGQVGDWIIAQAQDGSVSDWFPFVRGSGPIVLHCDGWVETPQLHFVGSGAEVSNRRILVSTDTGLPSLLWESVTNANGLMEGFLAPGRFRIEAVDRDLQIDGSGQGDFAWSVVVELKKLTSQVHVETLVKDLSAWTASVQDSESGAPIQNGAARIFRLAHGDDGIEQRIEVGKQDVVRGKFSLALLRVEELDSFELELDCPGYQGVIVTGEDPRLSLRERRIVFELGRSPTESIRFLDLQGSPIDRTVWLYDDFGNLVASGRPGVNGILEGVLGASGQLVVCFQPSKESVAATIPARTPRVVGIYTCIIDTSAELAVRFREGEIPNPFLVLHSSKGVELHGVIQGSELVFGPLASGQYSIGTREKLRESGTIQDSSIKYPIQLDEGELLVLAAKSSWSLLEGGCFVHGTIDHHAPLDLVVLPIFSEENPRVGIRAPDFVAHVLEGGDYSLWAPSKIAYVAVGSLDADGRLLPLAIFPADSTTEVLSPRRLYVKASPETKLPLTVMVLPSIPGGKVQGRIVHLLDSSEKAMVGWLQPGRHFLQLPGSQLQAFTMSDGGDCEVIIDGEGQIVDVGRP